MAADRSFALLAIGLWFGAGAGFLVAAGYGVTLDGHDHAAHGGTTAMTHSHDEMLSLSPGPDAPTLAISATPDPVSGWNLHILTTGFRFSPENASGAHVPGEGHAHVYIDGRKFGRVYGPWTHIPSLPSGAPAVEVTLNANDHRALAVDGAPLKARTVIAVD